MQLNRILRRVNKELEELIIDSGLRADSAIDDFEKAAEALILRILADNNLVRAVGESAGVIGLSNAKKYDTKIFKALGFDNSASTDLIENWVRNNVQLMKNTTLKEKDQLVRLFRDNAFSGNRAGFLEKEVNKIFKGGRNNIKLIAADQTGKLYGQLDEYKQAQSGIEGYYWRTTRISGRVRPAHAAREGVYFRWDSPPSDGHPGQPIRCMCDAEPAIDRIL